MKFSIIVNPVSRSGLKVFKKFSKIISDYGYEEEHFFTDRRGHAIEIVSKVKGDVILVAGGDGTLNEVVNGVIKYNVPLPIAPIFGGTGCDVARSLGVKSDPEERFREILSMDAKKVNPVKLITDERERYFVGVSDIGFGAMVAYRFDGLRRFGRLGYALGVMNSLYEIKPLKVSMRVDGHPYKGEVILVAFAHSPFFGGGMKISPNSNITERKAKVIVVEYVNKMKFLMYFPRVYNGTHLKIKEVKEMDVKTLEVLTSGIPIECEGEFMGNTPATYELVEEVSLKFV